MQNILLYQLLASNSYTFSELNRSCMLELKNNELEDKGLLQLTFDKRRLAKFKQMMDELGCHKKLFNPPFLILKVRDPEDLVLLGDQG